MEKHGKRWENKENMEKLGKTLEKVEVEKRWEEVATLMILFYDQTLRLGTDWPGSPWVQQGDYWSFSMFSAGN